MERLVNYKIKKLLLPGGLIIVNLNKMAGCFSENSDLK
jgi:hypothetical protein